MRAAQQLLLLRGQRVWDLWQWWPGGRRRHDDDRHRCRPILTCYAADVPMRMLCLCSTSNVVRKAKAIAIPLCTTSLRAID